MKRNFSSNTTTSSADTPPAVTPLPEDPAKALQDVMSTIDALRNLYVQETEMLSNADAVGFMKLQDEKLQTAHHYQRSISNILSKRDGVRAADPALKQRLAELYEEFSADIQQNQKALGSMRQTTDRLKKTISRATRDAARKKSALNYGKDGALNSDPKRVLSTGLIETA